jgi:hypothetical protein
MRDRHGKRPEPQLRGRYPDQRLGMGPIDEPEDAEPDQQHACADLDLLLPLEQRDKHSERKDHYEHRRKVADRQRPKRCHQRPRTFLHQPGRNGEWPSHPGIGPVIKAARDNRQPEHGRGPVGIRQAQTDG